MGRTRPIDPVVEKYFAEPNQTAHRQYLALRGFLFEGNTAEDIAAKYGYTVSTVYTIARDFKTRLTECLKRSTKSFPILSCWVSKCRK
jgi:tRNA G26 N,N-dimethylase Trm1